MPSPDHAQAASPPFQMPTIHALSTDMTEAIKQHIDNKTKPLGALGQLETVAARIATVQQTLQPQVLKPRAFVFAADHGIANAGVSPFPQVVTTQMVQNFLDGGAAINVFCQQSGIELSIVNAGIASELDSHPALINQPVAAGTNNYLNESAMTLEQCHIALKAGQTIVRNAIATGTDLFIFGEMGISNTSSAALIMSELLGRPLSDCVGRGTGLDDKGLQHKLETLQTARQRLPETKLEPLALLQEYGGFEIAMMVGALLEVAAQEKIILIDGFIVTSALLIAHTLQPSITEYCIASHCSGEQGHASMLAHLNLEPLLQLELRLGEGSGAAVAYPLIQSSLAFFNHMASFEQANVSQS